MNVTVHLEISFRWWARLYLSSVVTFAQLTGMTPDTEKVAAVLRRGTVARFVRES